MQIEEEKKHNANKKKISSSVSQQISSSVCAPNTETRYKSSQHNQYRKALQ